jgi:hypothetical protein
MKSTKEVSDEIFEKYKKSMPFRFMGTDIELYEKNEDVYDQLEDINGDKIRSISQREAFGLVDWPTGFVFNLKRKEGERVVERVELLTDENGVITKGAVGHIKQFIQRWRIKYGRENIKTNYNLIIIYQ